MRRLTARSEQIAKAIIEAARPASLDGVVVDPSMVVSGDDPLAIATSLFIYGEAYIGCGDEVGSNAKRLIDDLLDGTRSENRS
jgi:hypothetical protein